MDEPIRDIMAREVICVSPSTPVEEAFGIMSEIGIRHLPVLDGPRLVGIISDRDLLPLAARNDDGELELCDEGAVAGVMSRKLTTAGPLATIGDVAELMLLNKIDSVPIVDGQEFVGLVTSSDLVALLVDEDEERKDRAIPFQFTIRSMEQRPSSSV